jgi:hypothetical protein
MQNEVASGSENTHGQRNRRYAEHESLGLEKKFPHRILPLSTMMHKLYCWNRSSGGILRICDTNNRNWEEGHCGNDHRIIICCS